ncbi:MAG: adenylate/guanylate cyclase domain-containing protein [Gallionella sp.]|nr:adenylate/guanylate cyclase domain-containing protein [Gallionella sp.]
MEELDNKTVMCSVFFLDIVGYSKKSVTGQISLKDRFNSYLSAAIRDVPITDRIILDTGDGAAINFLGDIEDALKAALSLRESLLNEDPNLNHPLLVRMGINLGPVRLVRDINGQPNIVGDGINVAQRVMGFAEASQILVSRSYYDAVSRLSPQYAGMFHYQGSRTDKHVREHEVYAIGYPGEKTNPKLNKQSKRILSKALDSTRTSLRPAFLGVKFLHANLLQGFSEAGPVKRVLSALVIVIVLLGILEVFEEKLLGGAVSVAPTDNTAKSSVVPQSKSIVLLPASAPIVVTEIQPGTTEAVVPPVESPVAKKGSVEKKKPKNLQPVFEAEHKQPVVNETSATTEAVQNNDVAALPAKETGAAGQAAFDYSSDVDKQAEGNQGTSLSVSCLEGTEVFIDGTRKGKLNGASLLVPVVPGRHLVIVSHAKGMDWKFIKFKSGSTVAVNPGFCNEK